MNVLYLIDGFCSITDHVFRWTGEVRKTAKDDLTDGITCDEGMCNMQVQALDTCEIGYSADPSLHQRREHLVLLEKEVILIRKELSALRDVFMVGADQPLGKLLISV